MVDWHSPAELTKEGAIFVHQVHLLFGLYLWEFVTSFNFDLAYILRKRPFRWPMIFYFAGRYCLLFSLIGIVVGLNTRAKINCQALFTFNQLSGMASLGFASVNLSLRTMAVWRQNKYIVLLLVLVIFGHWSLILQGVLLETAWTPEGCVILNASTPVLAATFIYSMCFDFLVLALMAWKLLWDGVGSAGRLGVVRRRASRCVEKGVESDVMGGPGRLGRLIFSDGLIYFIIAFIANLLATVFMLLNLNPVMHIIFNIPAAVTSTIVASRIVRRLTTFATQGSIFCARSAPPQSIVFTGSISADTTKETDKSRGVHLETGTVSDVEDVRESIEMEAYHFSQTKRLSRSSSRRSSLSDRLSVALDDSQLESMKAKEIEAEQQQQ